MSDACTFLAEGHIAGRLLVGYVRIGLTPPIVSWRFTANSSGTSPPFHHHSVEFVFTGSGCQRVEIERGEGRKEEGWRGEEREGLAREEGGREGTYIDNHSFSIFYYS